MEKSEELRECIRKLEDKDAEYMFEWMQNESVWVHLDRDFSEMTLEKCMGFIRETQKDKYNIHLAVVDDDDEYQGTVSLKNIVEGEKAEFAIVMRECAMGTGLASKAMKSIIDFGFSDYKLKKIYWYVKRTNERAIRFYEKNGYAISRQNRNDPYVWFEERLERNGR